MNSPAQSIDTSGTAEFSKRVLYIAVLLALVAGGLYALSASSTATDEQPTTAPSLAPVDTPISPELVERFDRLDQAIHSLATTLEQSNASQAAIRTDLADLKDRLDKQVTAAKIASQHTAVRTVRLPQAKTESGAAPVVLSVDNWDGAPSAVLRDTAGRTQYVSVGDRIPNGTIQSIQVATQTVSIRYDDGSQTTLLARAL